MQHLLRFTNTVLKIMKMWDQQLLSKCLCRIDSQSVVSSQFYQWRSAIDILFWGVRVYGNPPPPKKKHGLPENFSKVGFLQSKHFWTQYKIIFRNLNEF